MLTGVLKQAVHGVQHLMRQVEEPLPGGATVVQPLLPTEHNVQPATQVLGLETHDLGGGREGGRERGELHVSELTIMYATAIHTQMGGGGGGVRHDTARLQTCAKESSKMVSLETTILMCWGKPLDWRGEGKRYENREEVQGEGREEVVRDGGREEVVIKGGRKKESGDKGREGGRKW